MRRAWRTPRLAAVVLALAGAAVPAQAQVAPPRDLAQATLEDLMRQPQDITIDEQFPGTGVLEGASDVGIHYIQRR